MCKLFHLIVLTIIYRWHKEQESLIVISIYFHYAPSCNTSGVLYVAAWQMTCVRAIQPLLSLGFHIPRSYNWSTVSANPLNAIKLSQLMCVSSPCYSCGFTFTDCLSHSDSWRSNTIFSLTLFEVIISRLSRTLLQSEYLLSRQMGTQHHQPALWEKPAPPWLRYLLQLTNSLHMKQTSTNTALPCVTATICHLNGYNLSWW